MNFETILVSVDTAAQTGIITLNRPDKRNALNARMVEEISNAVQVLTARDDVRVIQLRGNSKAFCSGADLESLQSLQRQDFEGNLSDSRNLRDMFYRIYSCPKPTLAVVYGPALAGGAGLATCCDFVVASADARFGYPEVKIGFVAALVMVLLTRQVGERTARNLLLTGNPVGAREALDLGLISHVAEEDQVEATVSELCATLVSNSPQAMMQTKELLTSVWEGAIGSNLDRAARYNARSRATDDCKEGVAAFLEKRRAVWTGRIHDIGHEA